MTQLTAPGSPRMAQIMAENTVNNEENLDSQSSQLEEEDQQKLEAESVLVNTKKTACSSSMAGGEVHVTLVLCMASSQTLYY